MLLVVWYYESSLGLSQFFIFLLLLSFSASLIPISPLLALFLSISHPCHILLSLPFLDSLSAFLWISYLIKAVPVKHSGERNPLLWQVFQIQAILYRTESNNWWREPFLSPPSPIHTDSLWYENLTAGCRTHAVLYELTPLTPVNTWWDKSTACWTCHSFFINCNWFTQETS